MAINWNEELDKIEQATRPITLGEHDVRIIESKVMTASSGNEMIRVMVKVEGGPDDGKTTWTNLVFAFDNPIAMKMLTRRLNVLGLSEEYLRAEMPSLDVIAGKLIGRVARAKITHREYRGEIQNDVDFTGQMTGPSAGMPPPVPIVGSAQPPQPVIIPPPVIDQPPPSSTNGGPSSGGPF